MFSLRYRSFVKILARTGHCGMASFKTKLYINGEWVSATRGGTFSNINPATGLEICQVDNGTSEDIDKAVQAARSCLNSSSWGYATTGAQRAVVLRKLGEIITNRFFCFVYLLYYYF